jgi:hypothetical protein
LEALFNFLNSVFALRARQGWILLFVCGSALTLRHFDISPFNHFSENWIIGLGIGFLAGAAVLVVCLVEWLFRKRHENSAQYGAIQSQMQRHSALEAEAVDNLDILDRSERTALAYIFRAGSQRFRGEARYNVLSALASKQIIGTPINSTAHDVWMVRSSIWEMRNDLSKKWGDIYIPDKAPWEYF